MGLTLVVGIMSELSDAKSKAEFALQFQASNDALQEIGLAPHHEPENVKSWSADGYGYSGLHALREVAGMLWKGNAIPREPLIDGRGQPPLEDQLFKQVLSSYEAPKPLGFFARLLGDPYQPGLPPFIHLVFHSDANGFYVPLDFPMPLVPKFIEEKTAQIWPIGSTQRLKAEIDQLAAALEIPDNLASQDDALWQAVDTPVSDQALWQAQPIAAYSAVILRDACRASLATGAAITFA